MGCSVLLFLLFLLSFFVAGEFGATANDNHSSSSAAAAAAAAVVSSSGEKRGPGFLYTRTRGRCTPHFWSSGRQTWPNMVPQESSFAKVFGSRALERYAPGLTMLEATQRNDDIGGSAFSNLVKQSSTALLNAYTRQGFPYTAWEVKSLLLEALVSEEAASSQAKSFEQANTNCH